MIKVPEGAELTLSDRCDRCGAQAFVRATLEMEDLLFCQHHYSKHYEQINSQAIWVHEQLEDLMEVR